MRPPNVGAALLAIAAVLVLSSGTASAQFEAVREDIERGLVERGVPSLAVAVARDGRIVWEEGFGWADRERRIPATEHTMYSLASISKPITATGLMVLVERGRIDLDRPVDDYLGDAKLDGRAFGASGATVRRMANHTSGLPVHLNIYYSDEPYRPPTMEETIRRYANLVTPPGERSQYSNLGYGIIGHIIERVSGKSYSDFMREEVFVPLGMTHSSVRVGPGLEGFTATRYMPDGAPYPNYETDHAGASAIFASAHDLVRFGMFHLKNHLAVQRRILTDASIDEMHRPTAPEGSTSGYGIGWASQTTDRGLRTIAHSGGLGGVSTSLILLPDDNAAVVVLCNSYSTLPGRIASEIVAVLAPDRAEKIDTGGGGDAPLPKALRDRYVGSYDLGVLDLRIFEDDGQLMVESAQGSSPLAHQGSGAFDVTLSPSPMRLIFDGEGESTGLTLEAGPTVLHGVRRPPGPNLAQIPELSGIWRGEVATYEGDVPVSLIVAEEGGVYVQLGCRPWTVLDHATFIDGTLSGSFSGDVGTPDADRTPYLLRLEVRKRDDVLNGSLVVMSSPGERFGNMLAHWIQVERVNHGRTAGVDGGTH